MAPKKHRRARKVPDACSPKTENTNIIPYEPSSSSAPARVISNTDDVDASPDNKSSLSAGTYIITNVGRKKRAALCSSDEKEGVVASLDGTNVIQEAGDEWIITHHGDSMFKIQNKRYSTYAGSTHRPEEAFLVECADFYRSYLWRIREQIKGEYMIENDETNVCWYLADRGLRSPVQLARCSTDPSKRWNFERLNSEIPKPAPVKENVLVNKTTGFPENTDIEKVYEWLRAVIPSARYYTALEKRLQHTGLWFIDSERFHKWKTTPGSFCWVHGRPGSGKTLLSAGIIQDILSDCDSDESISCAYFFFDGRGEEKDLQQLGGMVRSLIRQFAAHRSASLDPLINLYKRCHDGGSEPSIGSLWDVFLAILDSFPSAYIVIEALDECTEKEKVLERIKTVVDSKKRSLHLLVTSRDDEDIAARLRTLDPLHFPLQSTLVNHDIEQYIESNLQFNDKLARWDHQVIATIKKKLMAKAEGMFRWVSLQIEELQECHSNLAIEDQLDHLPSDLYGVYDRIIAKINKKNLADVHKILQWLSFAFEPLELTQVAEVVGVIPNPEDALCFEPSRVYRDPTSVLLVCSSLVILVNGTVMLSHMSVKDYLLTRTYQHEAYPLAINEKLAHSLIAQTCLVYLLQFTGQTKPDKTNMEDFPLACYAAQYWMAHVHSGPTEVPNALVKLVKTLFQMPCSAPFIAWVGIWNADRSGLQARDSPCEFQSPLYYASLTGMECVLPFLLEEGADVNQHGGYYGNTLQAASFKGHEAIVRILLEKGADVNAQGGFYGNALQAASIRGCEAIVEILLEKGADINAQGGCYHDALQGASARGCMAIVNVLLEKGADVNALGGYDGSALQAASLRGYEAIVKILLKNGADANAQGGWYGNALQAALSEGHEAIAKILLEKGAYVNAQGGCYGNALQAALAGSCEAIVKILLKNGADANAQGGWYGNALQVASSEGHEAIAKILLEKGAFVNAQHQENYRAS